MKRFPDGLGIALVVLAAGGVLPAQTTPPPQREANLSWVGTNDHALLAAHGTNADVLLRPGLFADRRQRQVRLWAEMTGLSGRTTPIEFFLIAPNSGHDYEALAVAFCRPSDVHAALEFIGLQPGHPVQVKEHRYWPRGERVRMTFEWTPVATGLAASASHAMPRFLPPDLRLDGGTGVRARAEELIFDLRTEKPLPPVGLAFAGSVRVPPLDGGTTAPRYAADVFEPNSIAANFNEGGTVLDVPRQAPQATVYGRQVMNPAYDIPKGQLARVTLEPEARNGSAAIVAWDLLVSPSAAATGKAPADLTYRLAEEGRPEAATNTDLTRLVAEFGRLTIAGREVFLTLRFDDSLSLEAVRAVCQFFATIDRDEGIRIEAPPAGHPYYQAFLPNESFRARDGRPTQPWELHLTNSAGRGLGILSKLDEVWEEKDDALHVRVQDFPVASLQDLRTVLDQNRDGSWVMLVYAPARLSYGALREIAATVLPAVPTLHIFLE